MSSQGQVCNPPCPSPCQSAFPHIACPYSLFLPKSFPKIVSRAGLQSSFSFSLSVSTFPYDAFLYSLFTPKCFQGQVCNPPFPSHFASPSSFLPSSYFSSKKIYVFTWKVQERNRMWKLCASARDPWRQHHPHLWHPLLQSPLQVIFLLLMEGFDQKFH